jgi:hypothetical protein
LGLGQSSQKAPDWPPQPSMALMIQVLFTASSLRFAIDMYKKTGHEAGFFRTTFCLKLGFQLRQCDEQVRYQPVVGDLEDGRVLVLVDSHDDL